MIFTRSSRSLEQQIVGVWRYPPDDVGVLHREIRLYFDADGKFEQREFGSRGGYRWGGSYVVDGSIVTLTLEAEGELGSPTRNMVPTQRSDTVITTRCAIDADGKLLLLVVEDPFPTKTASNYRPWIASRHFKPGMQSGL
ncbi:MAG: hypothetical protein R3C53_09285 [Pirellulaceae bacterium]